MVRSPQASVVVPTRNRAGRLRDLLQSLRGQSLGADAFEVIVVDDCSSDSTTALLQELEGTELDLRSVRRPKPEGPGAARNVGWRLARAPILAFTDDDCVAAPDWLEAGLAACRADPGCFVQGRTEPRPDELHLLGPFSYTLRLDRPSPHYETCNMFYPRELLERHGGFDSAAFPGPKGEDADLAWRLIERGVRPAFTAEALVYHAVHELGPVGRLKRAASWNETVPAFARHPGMRRARLYRGIYWEPQHRLLLRAAVGAALPRRFRHLRPWLAMPYLKNLRHRAQETGRGPTIAPYLFAVDLVEMAAVARGSLRHRTLVI